MKLFYVAMGLIACAVTVQAEKVVVVPPIEPNAVNPTDAFIIGKDAKMRTCPADANVYMMREAKGQPVDKNIYYVPPKQVLMSTPQMTFTIVCVKILP